MTALQQDTRRIRKQLNEANRKIQQTEQEAKRKIQDVEQEAMRKIQDIEQEALEAKRNAARRSALQMLQDGLNVETVARYVNMPIEAIQNMAQQFGSAQSGLV